MGPWQELKSIRNENRQLRELVEALNANIAQLNRAVGLQDQIIVALQGCAGAEARIADMKLNDKLAEIDRAFLAGIGIASS